MRGAFIWLLIGAHRRAIDARRRGRTPLFYVYSLLAGVTLGLMLSIGMLVVLALWLGGLHALAAALTVVIVAPFLGPWIVRHVCVPTGSVRAAAVIGRWSILAGDDPAGYGLVAGAWAHVGRPTPAHEKWIDDRRARRGMCGDAEIVAAGLVALARGDTDVARDLLASIGDLEERHAAVRELATECLAAIDAEAGDWQSILERAARPEQWPASPLTFLIEGCAQRMVGDANAPSRLGLRARWLIAPRRNATIVVVARALERTKATPAVDSEHATKDTPIKGVGPTALAAHVVALRGERADRVALARAARAWDKFFEDADTRMWAMRRAAELAAASGAADVALRDLRSQVAADLAELAEHAELATIDDESSIASEIAARARSQRLNHLELAFAAWEDRANARTALPSIDEWRAFLALRATYEQAVRVGGLELRRLIFPHALTAGGVVSAWLWNQRKEYVLSHAISTWLLAEARIVGDAAAIEHETHNCDLDIPVRAR